MHSPWPRSKSDGWSRVNGIRPGLVIIRACGSQETSVWIDIAAAAAKGPRVDGSGFCIHSAISRPKCHYLQPSTSGWFTSSSSCVSQVIYKLLTRPQLSELVIPSSLMSEL